MQSCQTDITQERDNIQFAEAWKQHKHSKAAVTSRRNLANANTFDHPDPILSHVTI